MKTMWITVGLGILAGVGTSFLADIFLVERFVIVGSFVGLEYSLNEGIAFGVRIPGAFQFILILAALFFVACYARKEADTKLSQVGFGLILGGGIANIIDRLIDGFVTDMIQVGSFPVFNVADSCITVGIAILFFEMVVRAREA
ncbi:signal peptidase II [Patescibacteria group bacterium]|nr:signal peptidase II [Patescibacteria group bacterium]